MTASPLERLVRALPRGNTLPAEVWRRRHRWMTFLMAWHIPALVIFGLLRGRSFLVCLIFVAPIGICTALAAWRRLQPNARASAVAIGLLWASATLVTFWNGTIEAHFHFFVVVSALATYEEWFPYLLAFAFVGIDHGVLGTIAPTSVYNHPSAEQRPWLWAGVHAGFIAALGVVNVVSWRMNEEARASSAASEARLRLSFESAPTGEALVGLDGTILTTNHAFQLLMGYNEAELVDASLDLLRPVEDRGAEPWLGAGHDGVEWRFLRKDGTTGWALWRHSLMPATDGAPGFWITHCIDVTERRDAVEELSWRAGHDALTGLVNRATFTERLGAALERRSHSPGRVAVLFVDLDNFKVVNDSLGHAAGDRLLDAVAERLRKAIRPEDVLARFGGDEFTVLVSNVRDDEHALRIADRLQAALQEPIMLDGARRFVSASIGLTLDREGEGAGELLRDADVAMYRAKELGKARAEIFDVSMRNRAVERLDLELALRDVVERGELRLVYQPQVGLESGAVTGVEALLRWDHPRLGPLDPERFIPLAEQTGLIIPIGAWILDEACYALATWDNAQLRLAVNISPVQLTRGARLVDAVATALARTGIKADRLCLEITETLTLVEDEDMMATLAGLRKLGVTLAIDDYGAGHASLGHLRALLPLGLETLKIDRSFVSGMIEDDTELAIVEGVTRLALSLGLQVVAEGVETEEQANRLLALGCRSAQGFYFSRPVGAAQIAALLDDLQPSAP